MNQQLEGWADEFGGDFELTIAGNRVVFVTRAEDIRHILLLRPAVFRRGWMPVSCDVSSTVIARQAFMKRTKEICVCGLVWPSACCFVRPHHTSAVMRSAPLVCFHSTSPSTMRCVVTELGGFPSACHFSNVAALDLPCADVFDKARIVSDEKTVSFELILCTDAGRGWW